jgi:predicted enzyme related to lactoylglutathione lyase
MSMEIMPGIAKTKLLTKDFMINYRVVDLETLVDELKKEGVTIVDKIETYDYGKFVHIIDAEENKVEIWEPS